MKIFHLLRQNVLIDAKLEHLDGVKYLILFLSRKNLL
jgi:hypothetical protein